MNFQSHFGNILQSEYNGHTFTEELYDEISAKLCKEYIKMKYDIKKLEGFTKDMCQEGIKKLNILYETYNKYHQNNNNLLKFKSKLISFYYLPNDECIFFFEDNWSICFKRYDNPVNIEFCTVINIKNKIINITSWDNNTYPYNNTYSIEKKYSNRDIKNIDSNYLKILKIIELDTKGYIVQKMISLF